MSRVVFKRKRTVEEKVEVNVDAAKPEDAVAAAEHMLQAGRLDWKYSKTVETTEPSVQVKE